MDELGKKRRNFDKVVRVETSTGCRQAAGRTNTGYKKLRCQSEDAVHRIDQYLADIDSLLTALIFISENVEEHQHELMCHSATNLCHLALEKIMAAGQDISLILRRAA